MGRKILIISPSWLGDIIMSQSLLKDLKTQDPDCEITLYAPKYAHSIIERMKEVDHILTNPFAHGAFALNQRIREGCALKKEHYDTAYILPNSLKSAIVPFCAGIKERIGLKGESRYVLLNRMRKDKALFPRMVERYVSLAHLDVPDAAHLPEIHYPQLKIKKIHKDLLHRLNLKLDRPLLCLGCGANYGPAKLWPVEYFAEVSAYYIRQGGAVLGLGTAKDSPTVQAIMDKVPAELQKYFYDISGKTNLTEALDLVGAARCAVCNDSGMMHTVAAADIPQVCIFGSTSTQYTPPLSAKAVCLESDEPCHPCFKRTCKFGTYQCLKQLRPEQVIAKLEELLQKYPAVTEQH